jgi:predicted LPLAT superfamily acyltransferase
MMMFEHGSRNINTLARAIDPGLERTVVGMGSLDSMLKLHDRMEAGEWVGMLGDRGLFDGGTVTVPFFGEPAAFPNAPFRLAAMFGRPVVLMLALYRGGNRYDLHFERLTDTAASDRSRAGREAAIREWVTRYAARLEHHCRQAPYNWFNFYDFWGQGRTPR